MGSNLLFVSFCFLALLHGCFAQIELAQSMRLGNRQWLEGPPQLHRQGRTECRIDKLTAQEPSSRFESEAGATEFWDRKNAGFECAGVEAVRRRIQPRGLLLPYYTNTPELIYIVQGSGIQGTVIPGCAETFESESESSSEESSPGGSRGFRDRHQRVFRFRQGDVLALPAGVANWAYNDGKVPIISVSLLDAGNEANQLDLKLRKFFLAGNSFLQEEYTNIFNGFDKKLLSDALNVGFETIRKLQGQDDPRGSIVKAENFRVVSPENEQEEEYRNSERGNGFEETLCTVRLRENIGSPTSADVYNPRGGLVSTVNSQTLPVLGLLQLSAERGALYKNAILAPHWNMNAHSIVYIIRGSGRIQVVGNNGKRVLDEQVREGQMVIIPENFVVVKKASEEGLEWVSFKTNDNAMTSPLAGQLSVIRGMPEEVLMNSYRISREDAKKLKQNRQELTVFGSSRSQREYSAQA